MEGDSSRVERFRLLYDALYPRISAYALRRARTREDASDVVSETFLVVWRRLDEIPKGGSGIAFVFGVVRRMLANHYRTIDRRDRLTGRLVTAEPGEDPSFDAVHEALDALRPPDREVLTLSVWDGLSNDEIAAVMGVKPSAVAVRLHRARSRLGRELALRGVGSPGEIEVKSETGVRTPMSMNGHPGEERGHGT